MAGLPIWIHSIFGFLAAAGAILVTWFVTLIVRRARGAEEPRPVPPYIISICYDPGRDQTTIQYSTGEQFFVRGSPAHWGECVSTLLSSAAPMPSTPAEPLTTAAIRDLLENPGDGVSVGPVRFTQEGGFKEN